MYSTIVNLLAPLLQDIQILDVDEILVILGGSRGRKGVPAERQGLGYRVDSLGVVHVGLGLGFAVRGCGRLDRGFAEMLVVCRFGCRWAGLVRHEL